MAVAETANLLVKMSLGGNFQQQLGKATKGVKNFDREASRAFKAGSQIGTGIKRGAVLAAAGVGILVTQIGFGLDQLIQLESLGAQTNAVLKSTGSIAGVTADEVRNLAEKYEGLNATVDDKVIQSGENLLLTYTAVNKKAFEPALQTALDLSTALGTDLNSAVKTVGKALSDPAKAAGKLARQGIILTKSEQKQIAAHLKNNDALGAQGVILAALQKRYGGSFLAGGNTTAGKVAKFGDAIEDLQKNLATALLPAIGHIADGLNDLFRDPATIAAVERIGKKIGELFSPKNIKTGIGLLKDGFNALKAIAGPIADVVGAAVKAFAALPPEIKTLLVGGFAVNKLTGGLVTNVFGGIAEAIAKSVIRAPLVHVSGGVVTVNGGIPGGGGGGGLPTGALPVAGGAALGLGTAVTILAIAPAAIAGLGIAITNAADPTHRGATKGKSDTASARGVPDSNNKNLQLLHEIDAKLGKGAKDDSNASLKIEQATRRSKEVLAAASGKIATQVEKLKGQSAKDLAGNKSAILETKREAAKGAAFGSMGVSATKTGASFVAAAVYASRPIVNVSVTANSFSKTVNVTDRYGNPLGSRNQGNTNEGGMGGH